MEFFVILMRLNKLKKNQITNEYRKGLKDKVNNNSNLQYQEHWTKSGKTIEEVTEEKIDLVNNEKTKQWFNENCKKATQDGGKAKSLVVIESSIKNKRRLAQKQREMERVRRREKRNCEKQRSDGGVL